MARQREPPTEVRCLCYTVARQREPPHRGKVSIIQWPDREPPHRGKVSVIQWPDRGNPHTEVRCLLYSGQTGNPHIEARCELSCCWSLLLTALFTWTGCCPEKSGSVYTKPDCICWRRATVGSIKSNGTRMLNCPKLQNNESIKIIMVNFYLQGPQHTNQNPHFEGFLPEWCISTIHHAWDTPFWLETLEFCSTLFHGCLNRQDCSEHAWHTVNL